MDDMIDDAEDESMGIDSFLGYVCSICDDGGDLLCCDGRCLRSFHGTVESGEGSGCKSLGFTQDEVDAIPNFSCKNCEYKQHQCFACGKLGSSDKSSGAEVFPCVSAICGRFYHPLCVAKLLCQDSQVSAEELEKKISLGDYFTCPMHKCCICKEVENKMDRELQFAVCMRCPKSYHRKCLPREIAFEDRDGIFGQGRSIKRAWEDILPNHILIYCTKHEIDIKTGSATRDHIKFPDVKEKKTALVEEKRRKLTSKSLLGREKVLSKQRNFSFEGLNSGRTAPPESKQKQKPSFSVKLRNPDAPDDDLERRILALMKDATASITLQSVMQKHKVPLTHENALSSKNYVDKTISLGKVESSTQAVRTALQKLEEGCSVEDAESICERQVLNQIFMWKKKLNVYLSPFLYGMRYTSFGRHFTKPEKIEQIVDRLHWYVQSGDMIVDFSCGSNDFSILMNKRLEETGKKCSYKNYDLIQTQKEFNFEKRDWMTVQREELQPGSRLIMGLNPPFGYRASLANRFIDKALEFDPKLLILIVPEETQRLDEKKSPYDLIWEDDELLSGKSFYLPGSVDVNDKQMDQWNLRAPPLYLWGRPDWSAKHRAIAQHHGHFFGR